MNILALFGSLALSAGFGVCGLKQLPVKNSNTSTLYSQADKSSLQYKMEFESVDLGFDVDGFNVWEYLGDVYYTSGYTQKVLEEGVWVNHSWTGWGSGSSVYGNYVNLVDDVLWYLSGSYTLYFDGSSWVDDSANWTGSSGSIPFYCAGFGYGSRYAGGGNYYPLKADFSNKTYIDVSWDDYDSSTKLWQFGDSLLGLFYVSDGDSSIPHIRLFDGSSWTDVLNGYSDLLGSNHSPFIGFNVADSFYILNGDNHLISIDCVAGSLVDLGVYSELTATSAGMFFYEGDYYFSSSSGTYRVLNKTVAEMIVEEITDGLDVVPILGSSLNSALDSIFFVNDSISPVAILAFTLFGLGISVGLVKLIYQWITGRHGM